MTIWENRLYPRESVALAPPVHSEWKETERKTPASEITERSERVVMQNTSEQVRETHSERTATTETALHGQPVYHTEVHFEVVNHNEIKTDADVERIAERLTDALRERVYAACEGVYA